MSDAPFLPRNHDWHPPALAPAYKTSRLRSPRQPLLTLNDSARTSTGPVFSQDDIAEIDSDLLHNHAISGAPIGERIIVHGRITDENGNPVPHTLVEIWQANASGRYRHRNDDTSAPLDPNFGGCGRTLSDATGAYAFRTIRPGAYPWPNGPNSWRPAHIHFSVFGRSFAQRLITQMYFEGDPLIDLCPIVQAVPTVEGRAALVAHLNMETTQPFQSLAYEFNIVLRGRRATPFENRKEGL